nr:hypothetical protein Iba_chr02aCG4960 [Ipomoea batatas]
MIPRWRILIRTWRKWSHFFLYLLGMICAKGETCSLECRRHCSVVQGTSTLLMGIPAPRFPRTLGRTGPQPSLTGQHEKWRR